MKGRALWPPVWLCWTQCWRPERPGRLHLTWPLHAPSCRGQTNRSHPWIHSNHSNVLFQSYRVIVCPCTELIICVGVAHCMWFQIHQCNEHSWIWSADLTGLLAYTISHRGLNDISVCLSRTNWESHWLWLLRGYFTRCNFTLSCK